MESCDPELREFIATASRKRSEAADVHATIVGNIAQRSRLAETAAKMPALTAEQIAQRQAEQERAERERKFIACCANWRDVITQRGERYADCRLETFIATTPAQEEAVDLVRGYMNSMLRNVALGRGLLLFGPRGTGKDHLAMAAARYAVFRGLFVLWQNGMDLFGDVRDAMDGGETERSLVKRMTAPDVLYLSDPLPPVGALTEFQSAMLFRIIDARYSRRRPTWCTVNVSSGVELDSRMGPQNADRLREEATAVFCNWPSIRKTA